MGTLLDTSIPSELQAPLSPPVYVHGYRTPERRAFPPEYVPISPYKSPDLFEVTPPLDFEDDGTLSPGTRSPRSPRSRSPRPGTPSLYRPPGPRTPSPQARTPPHIMLPLSPGARGALHRDVLDSVMPTDVDFMGQQVPQFGESPPLFDESPPLVSPVTRAEMSPLSPSADSPDLDWYVDMLWQPVPPEKTRWTVRPGASKGKSMTIHRTSRIRMLPTLAENVQIEEEEEEPYTVCFI